MKLWPFVVVVAGSILSGTVYILVREPAQGAPLRAARALPRPPMEQIAAPLPPRFSSPLPSRVKGFSEAVEQGPPLSYVRARLLEGDPEMGEKLLSALRQAAASARSVEELWLTYGVVLGVGDHELLRADSLPEDMLFLKGFQDQGVPCAWLRERLSEAPHDEPPLLTELLWRKLVRCPGAETTAIFAREEAPPQWALDHHSLFDGSRFTPALEGAVRRILEEGRQELFPRALSLLSHCQEPGARELYEALWSQANVELREEWERTAASQELLLRKMAEHPWKCPPIPTRPEGIDDLTVQRCVEEWIATSWAATTRFAMSASRSPELQENAEELSTLRNFSSFEEMNAWARARKLIPEAGAGLEEEPRSLFLSNLMRQTQRAFLLDLRILGFPQRHDDLLVTLAWKVHPELSGVVFEQLLPKTEPPPVFDPALGDDYTLRAYVDGQRFTVKAHNAPSMLDIGAVVGLLNQVLEVRGSAHRFAVLDTHVTIVNVVFGPESSLREADARGLWRLGDGEQVLIQAEALIELNIRRLLGEVPF